MYVLFIDLKSFLIDLTFLDLNKAEFYFSGLNQLIEKKHYENIQLKSKDFFMSGLQQLIEKQNNENLQLKRKNCLLESKNMKLAGQIKKFVKYLYLELNLSIFKRCFNYVKKL